ncbi:Motile sperm domain-containing protein 1 [Holothuria leucospilota]|uniref:Motile sperm domain-containing protein 1 n=1 Tax=Holothuria leucospilota TaxID=206669 RepID=A0A9Q1H3D7_HOLLE|nr:Motile sperm domain-containing protein 1 [Holothuria leucospilota]
MHWDRHPSSRDGSVPVFIFPTELTYYADDLSSHKQVLTLYNPYGFVLSYKVLSTAPEKYSVGDSSGLIQPGCCVDIVVRHKDVAKATHGHRDKFRIYLSERGQRKYIGQKDIPAVVLASARDTLPEIKDNFSSLKKESLSGATVTDVSTHRGSNPSTLVVFVAVICISALLLPTQGEKGTSLPQYLHLTMNQKLIAAYVLGLVTMVLLRA